MKTTQELQSPDVTALKPQIIAAEIEEIARGEQRFKQLLKENRDLVGKPGDYVDFTYRYGTPIFSKVATKLTEVSYYTVGFSSVRLTVEKWGGKLKFAREDLEAASRDVLAESLFEAGTDFAEQVDFECKLALTGAVLSTATVVTSGYIGTLASGTKLLAINSVSGSATGYSSADYFDGKIEVSGGAAATSNVVIVNYYHCTLNASNIKNAVSHNVLMFQDVQTIRDTIKAANFDPTIFVPSETQLMWLTRDPVAKFLDVSAYGSREAILLGEIGKCANMKCMPTTRQWDAVCVAVDPDHAGRFVTKQDLLSLRRELPEAYGLEYDLWGFFKPGLIKKDSVAVVLNVGGRAKDL